MLPPRLLNGTTRAFTIECLIPTASINRDLTLLPESRQIMRFVLPDWQRAECWDREKKVSFIEGVFLGFGTGFLVVNGREWEGDSAKPAPMAGWLLDGQQRVSAVRDFLAGEFPIFGDIYWPDIPRADQMRRFLHHPFPQMEIEYIGDELTLKSLYKRLNKGGVPHTEADMARVDQ
nr:DUF262 domain-containing protein [Pseudomonas fluorescens]